MLPRRTVPRLSRIDRHWLRPLHKRCVSDQSSDWHSCPHRATVNIWIIVVIGFSASKYDLEAETPTRHRCHRNCHSVQKLAMIFAVVVCVLASYPALKVRNVALQECHLRRKTSVPIPCAAGSVFCSTARIALYRCKTCSTNAEATGAA